MGKQPRVSPGMKKRTSAENKVAHPTAPSARSPWIDLRKDCNPSFPTRIRIRPCMEGKTLGWNKNFAGHGQERCGKEKVQIKVGKERTRWFLVAQSVERLPLAQVMI